MIRVGQGWDRHPLVAGRPCILGGIRFAGAERGPDGHSDADVLTHAIIDALLGAAGLGDIGVHFPDTDPAFAGADSVQLLRRTATMVAEAGFQPVNVDATVIAEEPRLAGRRRAMVAKLAAALQLPPERVNVKATRGEGMGPEGRGECITALAIATVLELETPAT
jgi:2-C-methyl-D-erythritol 2,4-cyclodiphosphate synthase